MKISKKEKPSTKNCTEGNICPSVSLAAEYSLQK